MTVTNDFLVFAQGGSANVESQASYAADPLLPIGNQPGIAVSAFNNKALRQANAITSQFAQFIANGTQVNVTDDATPIKLLAQITALLTPLAPIVTRMTSGNGTLNLTYYFFIASGNATAAATYTNNAITYTVASTISAGLILQASGSGAPTTSGTLTKASGTGDATITFYAVRAPIVINAKLVGGGGGGGAGASSPSGAGGGSGGSTNFGPNATQGNGANAAAGGGGGANYAATGGAGGTAAQGSSLGSELFTQVGNYGNGGFNDNATASGSSGGMGGAGLFGGGGAGSTYVGGGVAAAANSGGGGGGGANGGNIGVYAGGGGGAGGYVEFQVNNPTGFYYWWVGAGGAAGAGNGGGYNAGAGGSGLIVTIQRYQ